MSTIAPEDLVIDTIYACSEIPSDVKFVEARLFDDIMFYDFERMDAGGMISYDAQQVEIYISEIVE